jgi:NAD(P)-dependent dehydrogenase (short-subunit alcohol dehydrogenase family)
MTLFDSVTPAPTTQAAGVSVTAQVALVTGGSRGIGAAIAEELGRRGFDVAVSYRSDRSAADTIAAAIRSLGREAVAIEGDLSDPTGASAVVDAAVRSLGRLDVLVSNAGRMVTAPLLDTTVEDFDSQMLTNARAGFLVTQAAAKQMIAQGDGGRIVFITSKAAGRPVKGLSAYCMSKAALKLLTETAAIELAPHDITVNAVAPGTTETDLNRHLLADPDTRELLLGSILFDRPGSPRDIAPAVAFLVSDEARFITGATLAVDGGSSINQHSRTPR